MQDLFKVNERQLYSFWKNLSIGLLVLMATLLLSRILPHYFSPIIGLIAAAFLYTLLYNNKLSNHSTCMVVPYAMFYCVVVYSFASIIINVLGIWDIVTLPKELSFFNYPYLPALLLDPVCLAVLLIMYMRRNRLTICIDCKITKGLSIERGKLGEIMSVESKHQLVNLIWVFAILTVMIWVYYEVWYYKNAIINNRDWYVFFWMNLVVILFDEIYFASRYYNIYLDLKENGEIITEEELSDMTTKTYLRFYVVCGNKVFLNTQTVDPGKAGAIVADTPFVTKRNVNGISSGEVFGIISRLTGVKDGTLRFFYGRKSVDISKHRLLRYFYFLDGKPEDYPDLNVDGEWMDFGHVKQIYNKMPSAMSSNMLADLSRMTTIILTQKIFDERGYRRMKLKSYVPSYDLKEVREKDYDFQDDKWIRVAMYNSDTRYFHLKKFLRRVTGTANEGKWQEKR